FTLFRVPQTDVGQQSRRQRRVYPLGIGRFGTVRKMDANRFGELPELTVDVLPFPQPQITQILVATQFTELVVRELTLLATNVVPEIEIGQEIGGLVVESGMLCVRCGTLFRRTLPRVLDRQRGSDDHDLADATV